MFEFVRTHQRLMQGLLLLLIMPSFAFFGVQGFESFRSNTSGVASVAGQPIAQDDVDNLMRQQMQRMQQMLGPSFDPKMFDTPQARQQALDTLISQRVLQTQMVKDRLSVSDARVGEEIRNIPAIKSLYKPDGTLDVESYDRLLASVGLTREQLFAQTRNQVMMQQVTSTIPGSTILPVPTLDRLAALLGQQRDIATLSFLPAAFADKVQLAGDAAKKYYDSHASEFETPELLDIQYVVLDQAAVAARIEVSSQDIEAFYKAPANQARFVIPEQRRASHILIAVAKDAAPAERDKAKAKAQDILAKARANPAEFASLAKQYSDDPGSAEHGGDLDFAPAGNYVKPFSDALFALKDNQISDLVETEFGYHIIMLTAIRAGSTRPLEQVKGEIETELRKQKSSAAFSQAAEEFSNLVYDQPDTLKPVADKLGLTIQSGNGIGRVPNAKIASPVENAQIIDALFSSDVLKAKHNTAAIEVAPNTLVSARVVADHAPALRSFDDVKQSITQHLTDEAARQLALNAGQAKLAELKKEPAATGVFEAAQPLLRSAPGKVPAAAVKAIFSADASKLPVVVGVTGADGSYTIYRIERVSQGVAGPAGVAAVDRAKQQLSTQMGELEFSAYLEGLKKRLKVHVSNPAPAVQEGATTSTNP